MQLERANQAQASSRVAAFCFERATDPGYPSPVAALRPGADVLTEERGGRDAVAARGGLRRSPAAAANRPRAARLSRLQLPSRPAPSPSLSVPAAAPRRCSPPTVGGASAGEAASRASLPNVRWWPGWQRSAPSSEIPRLSPKGRRSSRPSARPARRHRSRLGSAAAVSSPRFSSPSLAFPPHPSPPLPSPLSSFPARSPTARPRRPGRRRRRAAPRRESRAHAPRAGQGRGRRVSASRRPGRGRKEGEARRRGGGAEPLCLLERRGFAGTAQASAHPPGPALAAGGRAGPGRRAEGPGRAGRARGGASRAGGAGRGAGAGPGRVLRPEPPGLPRRAPAASRPAATGRAGRPGAGIAERFASGLRGNFLSSLLPPP